MSDTKKSSENTTPKKTRKKQTEHKKEPVKETKNSTNTTTTTTTPSSTQPATSSDPDLDALHAMSEEDQLWFFIDDVVPTDTKDTEVIVCEDGITENGMPMMTLAPKSMEIFEEIANVPNHAASMYPNMTKYFADIIRLYNTVVRADVNPYWSTELIEPANQLTVQILIAIQIGGCRGFLSKTPKQNSVPVRLIYGDSSHKHDFVGIVYLYVN